MLFDFNEKKRKQILDFAIRRIEDYLGNTREFRTTPHLNVAKIRSLLETEDLHSGIHPEKAIRTIIDGLEDFTVHTPHPKYLGLFNPRSNFAGIVADLITATYNPQLAAWSHAPFAVEVEQKMIREFALKFGYRKESADGVFTTGGAEANLTAILCALNLSYPGFSENGLFGLNRRPLIFCSEEAHHSILKAAKVVGLGYNSVISIPTYDTLRLNTQILLRELDQLNTEHCTPLMVVGTAGTTGTGAIDDLNELADICKKHSIWFHVDAAYGGGAILSSQLNTHLQGIAHSDSITFDAHKWMSVPMGASLFLTSNKYILEETFKIATQYMPKEADQLEIKEPYERSIQWSRRFIGLKVYLSLLFYGWSGYEATIDHQIHMGNYLENRLREEGWLIKNNTSLPVVCFTHPDFESDPEFVKSILSKVLEKGKSWLSSYPVKGTATFRACITNYTTTELDIEELLDELYIETLTYATLRTL